MWPNPQETADLVTFTEEILNGKLHFLYSDDTCEQLLRGQGVTWHYYLKVGKELV